MNKKAKSLKSTSLSIFKDNDLNFSSFEGFSLNNYQIFLTLIAKLQAYKSFKFSDKVHTNACQRLVTLEAKEFAVNFNIPSRICYKILQNSVDQLLKTQVTLNKKDFSNNYTKINICSKAEYIGTKGKIEITFTEEIMPYLTELKKQFTVYSLKEISNFKSIHTTRLYELIAQYKKTGWILIPIDKLRKIFGVEQKLRKYSDFKKKTFAHACKEINKMHNMNLRFEEIKEGRKVVKIRFDFDIQGTQTVLKDIPKEISLSQEEILVSDEKLVQVPFVNIGPVIEHTPADKSIKQKKTSIDTSSTKITQANKEKVKESTNQNKSIWQSITSFFLPKN